MKLSELMRIVRDNMGNEKSVPDEVIKELLQKAYKEITIDGCKKVVQDSEFIKEFVKHVTWEKQ